MFGCGKDTIVGNISDFNCFLLLGGPVLNLAIWVGLRILTYDPNRSKDIIKDCPFFEKNEVDFYICEIPIFCILVCNSFFLIWIMVVNIQAEYLDFL